jgi:hypothetical protein
MITVYGDKETHEKFVVKNSFENVPTVIVNWICDVNSLNNNHKTQPANVMVK